MTSDLLPRGMEYVGVLPGVGMGQPVYRTAAGEYVTSSGWAVPAHIGNRLAAAHDQRTTRRKARRVVG